MHARRAGVSVHHESHNGMSTSETAGRLKQLIDQLAHQVGYDKRRILVKVDDDGVGGGVVDQYGEYNFVGLSASNVAMEEEKYPNRRRELWFAVAERRQENRLDLSMLSEDAKTELRRQFMVPKWKMDG